MEARMKTVATARLASTIISHSTLPPDFTCNMQSWITLDGCDLLQSVPVTRVRYFQPCSPVVSQNSLNIILATVLGRARGEGEGGGGGGGGAAVTSSGSDLAGNSSATHT